jgi:hypothetical protein
LDFSGKILQFEIFNQKTIFQICSILSIVLLQIYHKVIMFIIINKIKNKESSLDKLVNQIKETPGPLDEDQIKFLAQQISKEKKKLTTKIS